MKVRSDFVSNSSSCSFVIAINPQYDTSSFVKDLANSCSNPNSQYHHKDIVERNQRILDFCLHTYELAFLGTWKLTTNEYVYTKNEYINRYVDDKLSDNEKQPFIKEGLASWEYELKIIEDVKKPNADEYLKAFYGKNFIDESGKLHIFYDIYANCCVLNSDKMCYELNRYGYDQDNTKEAISYRINQLRKLAEEYADYEHGKYVSFQHAECYAITMNTIKNTRDLLNAKCDLTFEKFEDLDALEKRLANGQKLFVVNIGRAGDGWNNYNIYCEDNADSLNALAVEILHSEQM